MEDQDIVQEFLLESGENLAQLENGIVELEKRPKDPELLGAIFRTVHTIKGTCGFLGFSTLGAIAHAAETILGQLRAGTRVLSEETASLILEVVDATRAILKSIEATGAEGQRSYQGLMVRLKQAAETCDEPAPMASVADGAYGETASLASPSDGIWYAGPEPAGLVERDPGVSPPASGCEIPPPPLPEQEAEPAPAAAQPSAERAPDAPADSTVRLNVALLDALMNLAGELVLGRNQLSDAIARRDPALIQAASQRLGVVTSDVQDAVMRTRMLPLGNLFQKFPRLVRDTARRLGKEVNLVEEGAEVELDKTIIEGLSDPLTHMVRNAIDHGIETAAVRTALGKPAAGTLHLRAWNEAGLVVVEVADDGRGLDAADIAAAAVAQGLVSVQVSAAMTENEKLSLIFLPGFSTAQRISDISGRGVGLDVVKTNLDQMGGKVEIHSQPGKGAAFRIKLPLTLAIIPSLLVSSGADRLAVPLANVQELVRIPAAEIPRRIDHVGSASVLMLRDLVVPLVHLARALDLPAADAGSQAAMNVVILSGGRFHYGLIVESLHGTVDIVVKPLGRHVKDLHEFAGATILGDGSVALILDVAGLASVAGLRPQEESSRGACDVAAAPEEKHHLLLFHNSAVEVCAVPLRAVSRVVKIQPEQVEAVGGRRTMQHCGQTLPLVMLADTAQVEGVRLDRNSIVVIMEAGGRQFGLLGSRPVDVVEVAVEIDPHTLRQPGVLGSAILRDRTVLVLEASELARAAWPDRGEDCAPAKQPARGGPSVRIADPPAFFREHAANGGQAAVCDDLSHSARSRPAAGGRGWKYVPGREGSDLEDISWCRRAEAEPDFAILEGKAK